MPITPVKELVENARSEVDTWSQEKAASHIEDSGVKFVDIRDIRELWREGTIPDSIHAPRGMLEFWFDPSSPYAKDVFQTDDTFVLYCASGWRSALAAKALKDMGFSNIASLDGGFSEWKEAQRPVEAKEKK